MMLRLMSTKSRVRVILQLRSKVLLLSWTMGLTLVRTLALTLALSLPFSSVSHAGYIQLLSQPSLKVELADNLVWVHGPYSITEKGTETAKNIFLELSLGKWNFKTQARELAAGANFIWNINEKIPLSKLECTELNCKNLKLPERGIHALKIIKHYEDLNGYKFTAPEVLLVTIGQLSGESLFASKTPALQVNLNIKNTAAGFEASAFIKNPAPKSRPVLLEYFTSQELGLDSTLTTLQIQGNADSTGVSRGKNLTGLQGSNYPVFAVASWEEAGIRVSSYASGYYKIPSVAPTSSGPSRPIFFWFAIAAIILMYVGFGVFYHRVIGFDSPNGDGSHDNNNQGGKIAKFNQSKGKPAKSHSGRNGTKPGRKK